MERTMRPLGKILVTGATGFLGGALVRRLVSSGHDVFALGRNQSVGRSLGCEFRSIELSDAAALVAAHEGIQTVFHCGALSAPWGRSEEFEKANFLGAANVLLACKANAVARLIHVSTPSIYFRHGDGMNVREDAPLPLPVNDYARTKLAAEKLVRAGNLPHVILRPRAIFGPGDRTILPRLIRAMQRGRLKVIGTGTNITDLSYIDNVVDALILAGTADSHVEGNIYNITNGEPLPLWDLVKELSIMLNLKLRPGRVPRSLGIFLAGAMELAHHVFRIEKEPFMTRYGVGVLTANQTLDISAAKRDLGYEPQISVREGLRRFAEWWKEVK